jgi:rifampicin phosphotransferase
MSTEAWARDPMFEMDGLVLPIDSPRATLVTAGGKGANLSELARAGFPVPAGFVIGTAAYRAFVRDNDLQERILAHAEGGAATDFADASAAIRQLFEVAPIPPGVATAIRRAYAAMCPEGEAPVPVAVRSSATAEDLPGASFAGQQDSYLNVRGEAALLEAVKRCWSSLWTDRALAYRTRQGIDPASVTLAVVVQALVPAEAAGVLFTANPLTGARDEVVIDAAWGLGEAIVSGQVTPDHVIASKASGAIREMETAEKAVMTAPAAAGTEERAVAAERRRAAVLDAERLALLVSLARDVEAHYGAPQDIEWCLAGDRLWIVQSRPITTLPPEPVRWESPVPGAKWLKDIQAAEWATEPLSPLGATTTFASMIDARQRRFPMQKRPWSALVNGWLYIRADFRALRMMVFLLGWLVQLAAGRLDGRLRARRIWPGQLTLLDSLERSNRAELSDDELEVHADRLLEALSWWWWEVSWNTSVMLHSEMLIGMLGIRGLANPSVLFRGNESLLLEAERDLRRAVETGDIDPYLATYGHSVESADPIHPTLRESPQLLARHLAAVRQSEVTPDERLARTRLERTRAEALVRALRGPRGFLARRLLNAGQSHAAQVDDCVFHFQRVVALVRATFLEAGRRLARRGTVERGEDVFYMERSEVWAPAVDLSERLARRRLLRESQKRLVPPPSIPPLSDAIWGKDRMLTEMKSAGVQERNGQRVLAGISSSPGRAQGIARVVSGPHDFHRFQPGDVLVAHTTTPVWTPLLDIASAAVTEVGGRFNHAAIVAREFGIPLVTGVLDATRVIEDGAPVVVDGSAGIVELSAIGSVGEAESGGGCHASPIRDGRS